MGEQLEFKEVLESVGYETNRGIKIIPVDADVLAKIVKKANRDFQQQEHIIALETEVMKLRQQVRDLEEMRWAEYYKNNKENKYYGSRYYEKKGQAPNYFMRQQAEK